MKRLIMICVFLQAATMYGQLELGQLSMPEDQLKHDATLHKDETIHESNLDTIDVDGSGNWLEKRIWFEQAQNAFDDILLLVNRVVDMRIQFSNEVNAVGHTIDSFYEAVYFDKEQLDDKFKEILVALEFEQKLKGDLTQEERALQNSIKQELASIDQLGKNIKLINVVDIKIDQALMQAFKTIDECRDYEAKAWATFKLIGKEIDDKKARNLYYEMQNFKENIQQKSTYLSSSLLPYLHNTLVAKIDSIIASINQSIEQLKQKGIDLSNIMKTEQANDVAQLQEREKTSNAIAVEKALEEEREREDAIAARKALALKKKQEASWSFIAYNFIAHAVTSVQEIFVRVGDFFVHSYFYISYFISNFMTKETVESKKTTDTISSTVESEHIHAPQDEAISSQTHADDKSELVQVDNVDHAENSSHVDAIVTPQAADEGIQL